MTLHRARTRHAVGRQSMFETVRAYYPKARNGLVASWTLFFVVYLLAQKNFFLVFDFFAPIKSVVFP